MVTYPERLSSTNKCDNELKTGSVHRFVGIYLAAEEKLRKNSDRRPPAENCKTS